MLGLTKSLTGKLNKRRSKDSTSTVQDAAETESVDLPATIMETVSTGIHQSRSTAKSIATVSTVSLVSTDSDKTVEVDTSEPIILVPTQHQPLLRGVKMDTSEPIILVPTQHLPLQRGVKVDTSEPSILVPTQHQPLHRGGEMDTSQPIILVPTPYLPPQRGVKVDTSEPSILVPTPYLPLHRVVEITRAIHKHVVRLDEYDETFIQEMDLPSYLEYVDDERIFHMPRRGSNWDRVLRSAQFFGLQLWSFGDKLGPSSSEIKAASVTALVSCRVLLDIGHRQAAALASTFDALYELGVMLAHVSQIHDLFQASESVTEVVADLYTDVIELVGNIAVFYRKRLSSLSDSGSVTINFDAAFGSRMAHIWETKALLTARVWKLKVGNNGRSEKLDSVRRWLRSSRSSKASFYDRVGLDTTKRAEDTCEWLKPHLVDFLRSKDNTFAITGPEGSGKTVLADWVQDRLQRPLNHTQYYTLSFTFQSDFPEQSTQTAFLKDILFQLLERNVGDVQLFDRLVEALEKSSHHVKPSQLEASLWAALESGLKTLDGRQNEVVLVVDGLDEVSDHPPVEFLKTLRNHTKKFQTVNVVTLSKDTSLSEGCRHLSITPQALYDDIRSYFRQSFAKLAGFAGLKTVEQDTAVDELAQKVKASFIWAYVVIRYLTRENSTPEKFLALSRSIPDSFDGGMDKLLTKISLKDELTKTLISFLLVARRSLSVNEWGELLSVNLHKREVGNAVNVAKKIRETCSDIVIVSKGQVVFKSKSIRAYLHKLMGHSLPSAKDANHHLTLVLLLYAKYNLGGDYEPSLEPISERSYDELFQRNILLGYVVQHWLVHFRSSTLVTNKGELHLTSEFGDVFPATSLFPLLERSCWHSTVAGGELYHQHDWSLKIRTAVFGEKHVVVFQTLVILGSIQASHSHNEEAGKLYYRAVLTGREVLSRFHAVVVACTSHFLKITETITITTRTEIATYREQIIIFMIEICKAKYGPNHEIVIRWYKTLAKLYVSIKEEHRATAIYKILYEIYVAVHGKKSPQARSIGEYLGGLNITLEGDKSEKDITEYQDFFLESTEELDIADEKRFTVLLRRAAWYESQKMYLFAEKIYITLWRRFSQLTHGKATVEIHLIKINIAIDYSRFLQRLKRIDEASNILICLWAEYEHSGFENETIVIRIREIGLMFRAFGLLHVAVSVFGKIWGWFKATGKADSDEALKTTIYLTEVVEETTETTVTTKTTTTTHTEVTEIIVREVFETHFERCKKTKVDRVFFSSCLALVNIYISTKNWAKAEIVLKQSLELTWKVVLTADVTIKLSEHFSAEIVLIAQRLALCYHEQRVFEKAEAIYLRIFYASLASLHIDDIRITQTCGALIAFYEEYHRHEKIIEIYVMLADKYRKQLGAGHKLTIQVLYTLAGHCKMLGRKDAYQYYIEIVTVLNKGRKHCHPDAFEAAVVLLTYYYEEKHWKALEHHCVLLWDTFVHHTKTCHFTEEVVQILYERYVYVLEVHVKVQLSVLYKISVEYRTVVETFFGVTAQLVITALLALALICEREETHYHESVTIYEEVLKRITTTKTTTTTTTETTVTTVKKRLTKMYVTIVTTGSKTATTTTTIERAILLSLEVYAHLKIEFGCWHEKTLWQLHDIILLYHKHGSKEYSAKILTLLQASFVEILIATCGSVGLYQSAIQLASIYVEFGYTVQATSIVQQIRHIIIFGSSFDAEVVIKLDKSPTRAAFAFLVAFEQRLVSKTVMHYSELMASILFEMTLYEQYHHAVETKESTEVILEYGAKLRAYWVETRHEKHVLTLDVKLFQIFKHKYGGFVRTHDDHTKIFYRALVVDLGRDRAKVDFAGIACRTGNSTVLALLEAGDFKCAIEVARCTFGFASKQGFYDDIHHVCYAFKLAEYMAGIDVKRPSDTKLFGTAKKLSEEITVEVLAILRSAKIDMVRLQFEEVEVIIRLLGAQGMFKDLEELLTDLWHTREVQKKWTPARVLTVGRMLVHAHAANKNVARAIDLCDRMCYNLRRSRGALDQVTVEMSQMLASLDIQANQLDRAMNVHEQILREIAATCAHDDPSRRRTWNFRSTTTTTTTTTTATTTTTTNGSGGPQAKASGEAHVVDTKALAATANLHFELLRRAHIRRNGWPKPQAEYQTLYEQLLQRLGKALQVAAPNTWEKLAATAKPPTDHLGVYAAPDDWKLEASGVVQNGGALHNGHNGATPKKGALDHVWVAVQQWQVA